MVAGWGGRMGGRGYWLLECAGHPGHHTPDLATWNPSNAPPLEGRAVSPGRLAGGLPSGWA